MASDRKYPGPSPAQKARAHAPNAKKWAEAPSDHPIGDGRSSDAPGDPSMSGSTSSSSSPKD